MKNFLLKLVTYQQKSVSFEKQGLLKTCNSGGNESSTTCLKAAGLEGLFEEP